MNKKIIKILIIQSPHYDFVASTLIEGLKNLIDTNEYNIELLCSEKSNYARHLHASDDQTLIRFGKESDIVVLCSNNNVKEYLMNNIESNKWIFLDGEDTSPYKKDPSNYVLYFKREMLKDVVHPNNVKPFQFAAENRYFKTEWTWTTKKYNLACMFGPHDASKHWRTEIEQKLKEMSLFNSFVGSLYGGKQLTDVDTGGRAHEHYFNILSRSKISVDAYGAYGCQAARFYESLANGCCLLTQPIKIHMSNPFISGEHLHEYNNLDELSYFVDDLLNKNNEKMKKIAFAGFHHLSAYHTTTARARYFLNECKIVGLI